LNLRLYIKNGDCRAHPKADNELGASQETNARQSNKLTNSWGDKTRLELFVAGVRGWEAYPRRRLDDRKPVEHVAWGFTMSHTRSASAAPITPGAVLFIT